MTDLLLKFKLLPNSKNPTSEWEKTNIKKACKVYPEDYNGNLGIITGKVNNVTVVDCDFYDTEKSIKRYGKFDPLKNEFIKTFGKDYVDYFDTLTVETPGGGYHMYFEYEPETYNTASEHRVDIRTDGGYIVSPGSQINGKEYININLSNPIRPMPSELKEWIMDNVCTRKTKEKKAYSPKALVQKDKTTQSNDVASIYNWYLFDKDHATEVFSKLDKTYWTEYDKWLEFTTACKVLGYKSTWDFLNKTRPGYDEANNERAWNGADSTLKFTVESVLLSLGKEGLAYHKYKPILSNHITPDVTINRAKLLKHGKFFKPNTNYVVWSDTGTGKTTAFKQYAKDTSEQFVSIVSRVSLGEEQTAIISNEGIDTRFYKYLDEGTKMFDDGMNCIVQLESIRKLGNLNLSNYVLFLDEFSSIIKHLVTSKTLDRERACIFKMFVRIIDECKQVICTDADINETCLDFLSFTNKKFVIVKNEFLHNKNVEAEEIFDRDTFIIQLQEQDAFLCCCDSKTEAELLFKYFKDDPDCILITSDTDEYINLDSHKKVIFSPKVIYGLDSTMERPVYCYYNEHTIDPPGMLQQISRCRNITYLRYLFTTKEFRANNNTIEDVRKNIIAENVLAQDYFRDVCGISMTSQYQTLLEKCRYNQECYNTNKFAHFLVLLEQRGFKNKRIIKKTIANNHDELKELKEELLATFNAETAKVSKINKYLKLPDGKIEEYKEFFIDKFKLEDHYNVCRYLNNDDTDILDRIRNTSKDFKVNTIKSTRMKIYLLKVIKAKAGCPNLSDLKVKNDLDVLDQHKLLDEYNLIFANRNKSHTLSTKEGISACIMHMYRHIFSKTLLTSRRDQTGTREERKQQTLNKTRKTIYEVNMKELQRHETLYQYRAPKTPYIQKEEKPLPNLFKKVEPIISINLKGKYNFLVKKKVKESSLSDTEEWEIDVYKPITKNLFRME